MNDLPTVNRPPRDEGERKLTSCHCLPWHPRRGVLILTAQRARDIVGIDRILRLQARTVVAKGANVLSIRSH
ncbi:MAG: hypothetical protein ACE5JX_21680 [Acidobacteriota bacterium]